MLKVKHHERVIVRYGDVELVIFLSDARDGFARLAFDAPLDVSINREIVQRKIDAERSER